jgi:hypothetical protein
MWPNSIYYDEKGFKVAMKKVSTKGWKRRMHKGRNGEI